MNKDKLAGVMRENRDTQESLANYLGITRQTLSNKIHEKDGASFTWLELKAIWQKYKLSDLEFLAIFFADCVS